MNTIGVLGGRWRASVDAGGAVHPWDESARLDWFIAADDRWHVPSDDPTTRQRRLGRAPVIETRIKIPNGDAIHRVWCVADADGLTVIEIENDSPLPFAVAFNRNDLLARRPAADVPIHGLDLPAGSVVFPIAHHTSVRFGIAHHPGSKRTLPDHVSSPTQVARGWMAILDAAGRLALPDDLLMDEVCRLRSELALGGPVPPAEDPVGFLIDVGELVRLGEQAEPWVPDVADAVAAVARLPHDWNVAAALDAAACVLARAGESRAGRDLAGLRSSHTTGLPAQAPQTHVLAWHEHRLARSRSGGTAELLAGGIPVGWLGANFEVHGLPIGPATTVSYAVRWHGDRPAVLWETNGVNVTLAAPVVAPGWSTSAPKGEALWPAPPKAASAPSGAAGSTGVDFSFS